MSKLTDPDELFRPLVERAIELATQWHDGTYRKGSWREPVFEPPSGQSVQVPAMAHLAAVASIVRRAGWSDVAVAAAYLHDAIEDRNRHGQRLRREQLRAAVGPKVTRLVAAVSEKKLDAEGQQRPWRARKEDYAADLCDAPTPAVGISLADKLHNLWSINQALDAGEDVFTDGPNRTALSAGPEAQRWFYQAVLEASTHHDDSRLPPMRSRLQTELHRFESWISTRNES